MLPGVAFVALDEEVWVDGFVVNVVQLELLVSADTACDFCGFFFVVIRLDSSRSPRFQLFRVFHCDLEGEREKKEDVSGGEGEKKRKKTEKKIKQKKKRE